MARNNDRDRGKRVTKDTRPSGKKKVCLFCSGHVDWVDYKDVNLLRRFMSDRGKIRSRRVTGNCVQHQRSVAMAIKTALLPYTQRTVSERGPGRGRGRQGSGPPEGGAELVLTLAQSTRLTRSASTTSWSPSGSEWRPRCVSY
jgi:small subunit ribosomal protein S18